MKVLFVASGNSKSIGSPIVLAQGESLKFQDIAVDYYFVRGKGMFGYLNNVKPLTRILKSTHYDIIHAHYGLTGIIALIARKKQKLLVSFMGDDIIGTNKNNGSVTIGSKLFAKINTILAKHFYDFSIVKTKEMLDKINSPNTCVIPNGVNNNVFVPIDKQIAREITNINANKFIVIFVGNPIRTEKNFQLAFKAVKIINSPKVELITLYDKNQTELVNYYNSADLLVLTSYHEGSPNVIKEAMSCNCPIVSTDVGDVRWIMGDTEGCYLTSFDPKDVAEKISLAIRFSETTVRTSGRQRILDLGLDSATVAKRLIEVYNKVLN